MSRLGASKQTILSALEAGGLTVSTTGKFAAPCVLVEAGDPWASVDLSLGRKRTARWRLTIVAGRADSDGNAERLADMVDEVDVAILTVPGAELPTWGRPFDAMLDGIAYGVTQATIQHITQEG